MALINTNGNYLKVISVNFSIYNDININGITYNIYKDQDARVNGLEEFETIKENNLAILNLNLYSGTDVSDKDILLRSAYLTLKNNGFEDWIDV